MRTIYNLFTKGELKKPTEKTALLELAQPLNSVAIDIWPQKNNDSLPSKKYNSLTPCYGTDCTVISFLTLKELCHLRGVSKTIQENIVDYYFNNSNLLSVLYKIERLSLHDKSLYVRKYSNLLIMRGEISSLGETKLPVIIPSPEFKNADNGISAVLLAILQNISQAKWGCSYSSYLLFIFMSFSVIFAFLALFVLPGVPILKSGEFLFDCNEIPYRTPGLQSVIPEALSHDIEAWVNASHSLIKTVEGIILFCNAASQYCVGIVDIFQRENNGTYVPELGANVVCANANNIAFSSLNAFIFLVGMFFHYLRCANSLSEDQLTLLEGRIKGVVARDIDQRFPVASEEILEDTIGLRI